LQELPTVRTLLRRFRSPLVALIAIIFSASIAMAGQPAGKGQSGLTTGSTHAGKTVPVKATDEQSGDQDESEPDESTDTDTEDSDSADNCTVDLTQDASALAELNHGSVVCTAAQQDTPEGYANHGAWVSHWAKMNHGADASTKGTAHKPSH
jgi:hypothetical protein